MNFSDLKTELADRGFSDLSDTRLGRYINYGRAELDRMFLWPWRESSVSGDAPLQISDLGPVEAVVNVSAGDAPLQVAQWRDLVDWFQDLSRDGTPVYYYTAWVLGEQVVATYPTNADEIAVQYWKITPDLVNNADEPESPSEAHYLIVDLAVRRASRDINDHQGAEAIQSEIDRQIQALYLQYQPGLQDGLRIIVSPGSGDDWG